MRNLRNSKGFTLIELMIVVVIIGILAAIAIPKFTDVAKSSKEAEADPILKQAFTLQESYKHRHDIFATDAQLQTLGWSPPTDAKYYTFAVKGTPTKTAFCVEATTKDATVTDTKKIDQSRNIVKGTC